MNPYESTSEVLQPTIIGSIQLPPGAGRGMVGQIPVLGILMIIQGALNALAGAFVSVYAVLMPTVLESAMRNQPAGGGGNPPPANMALIIGLLGGLLALALLIAGAALIAAGIGVLRFQARNWAIGALLANSVTLFTCYCFPTSACLAIYGLILLLNDPVRVAFELRRQGHSVRDIQVAFLQVD